MSAEKIRTHCEILKLYTQYVELPTTIVNGQLKPERKGLVNMC